MNHAGGLGKTNPIFRRQTIDDGKQMSENRGQITEVYPQEAGQRTACPAGTAINYDMHPTVAKKVLT